MQQLTGQDAMFLHMEMEGFPMHIGGVAIYDQSTAPNGIVRFKDILKLFESRLDRSPIFRRKLLSVPMNMDQPYWIDDDNFDLEFHVRHVALPKPGDWRQLCIQVARLHARPLDRARPMWEAYVIEGLNNVEGVPEGSFALYLKVHHAAMDGASGINFFAAFNDFSPEVPEIQAPVPFVAEKRPGNGALLGKSYINSFKRTGKLYELIKGIRPARERLAKGKEEGRFSSIEEVPVTRFNGKLSSHRVVDAERFDFEDIRAIKNSVEGATINDAVLTIVSGAMQKYLEAKGENLEHSLVGSCPIDVRDESEREAGGNMIGMMNVRLCSDVADPKERLAAIHQQSTESKAYAEALGPRIGMEVTDSIPVGIQSSVMQIAVGSGLAEKNVMQNTVVTNVPGSPCQLYLCGAEIVDSFGIGPITPGAGLFHTVNSAVMNKKGAITLAFVACRDVLPDPEFYTACIRESFDELYKACLGKKPAAKKKTAVKRKKVSKKAAA